MASLPVVVSAHAAVLSPNMWASKDLDRVAVIVEHHLGQEHDGVDVLSADDLEQEVLHNLVWYGCFVQREEDETIVLENKLLIIDL